MCYNRYIFIIVYVRAQLWQLSLSPSSRRFPFRKTVPGVWGIHKLAALVKDNFVIDPGDELSVVFATHNYKRLKVVTVDATGVELRISMFGYFAQSDPVKRSFYISDSLG